MPNTTFQADGRAMSATVHSITSEDLDGFNIFELFGLYEALRLSESVLDGVMCQQRYKIYGARGFNPAGKALDALNTHIVQIIDLIVTAARCIDTAKRSEITERAWMLLKHEATYQEDLDEFLLLACEQTVAASKAGDAA